MNDEQEDEDGFLEGQEVTYVQVDCLPALLCPWPCP